VLDEYYRRLRKILPRGDGLQQPIEARGSLPLFGGVTVLKTAHSKRKPAFLSADLNMQLPAPARPAYRCRESRMMIAATLPHTKSSHVATSCLVKTAHSLLWTTVKN
jgi:hypothetical protein